MEPPGGAGPGDRPGEPARADPASRGRGALRASAAGPRRMHQLLPVPATSGPGTPPDAGVLAEEPARSGGESTAIAAQLAGDPSGAGVRRSAHRDRQGQVGPDRPGPSRLACGCARSRPRCSSARSCCSGGPARSARSPPPGCPANSPPRSPGRCRPRSAPTRPRRRCTLTKGQRSSTCCSSATSPRTVRHPRPARPGTAPPARHHAGGWRLGTARCSRPTSGAGASSPRPSFATIRSGMQSRLICACGLRRPETRRPGAGEGPDEILAGARSRARLDHATCCGLSRRPTALPAVTNAPSGRGRPETR